MMMISTSILFIINSCQRDKLFLKMEMFMKEKSAVIFRTEKGFIGSRISQIMKENLKMVAFMEEEN
jgi:hypothetical protein